MGDHEGGELVAGHDLLGDLEDFVGCLGVQGGGVLVQQEQAGFFQGGHEQGQGLTLAAGEQADFAGHAVLQPQAQGRQLLAELLPLLGGDAGTQGAALAAAVGQGEVFFDAHGGGGAHHGVLEDAAEILGAFVLRQAGDVHAVQNNIALVGGENAGDEVQGGGFAGTVAADDGDEIAVLQGQVQAVDGAFLVDGPGIKRLIKIFQFKHGAPPLRLRASLCSGCACSSSRARPGTRPPPGRRRASSRCCSGPWSGRSG